MPGHPTDPLLAALAAAHREARSTLAALPSGSRSTGSLLYAAAAAERLFRWYDATPEPDRRPYSETWRPVLGDLWAHLGGDATAYARVSRALGEFHLSPYSNDGTAGPDDIDQDEAAATLFAANCLMHGMVEFALLAAGRATDHLDTVWFGIDDDRHHREITAELARQRDDLEQIAAAAHSGGLRGAAPPDLLEWLRR